MIDAKSLRIGNWILDNSVMGEIKLKVEAGTFYWVEKYPDSYNPIPLTQKILEKCGFRFITDWTVKDEREHDCTYFLDLGYMFISAGMMSNTMVTLFQSDKTSTGVNIQYLHHLQNVYYALTNQELNITL